MEIRVLQYFLTVAREESITKAAKVLHITQPTLSRQLTQLEEETGVKLFRRGLKKITLTNEGLLLRRRAEEIVALVDKTGQELAQREEQVEGVVSIGSGEVESVNTLTEVCRSFREKYPRVRFDMFTATADILADRMADGLTDIGLLLEPVNMEEYEFIRIPRREKWVVLMQPDDPLTAKDSVTAKDLERVPLILPRRLNVQSELANWFGDAFGTLDVAVTGNLSTNAALMVQKGIGYAVVITGSLPLWDQNKIAWRPLAPQMTASTVLAWRRNQPFGVAAEKFIEYAKQFLSMSKT